MTTALLALTVLLPMIFEAIVASRHERTLRARGAVEPEDDVFTIMRFAYPGAFLLMVAESSMRRVSVDALLVGGAGAFVASKALKYWAIATLGTRWTFRVLVPPASARITWGPYRLLRHPNYVAVIGELVAFTMMARAWVAGPLATLGFGLLVLARIRVEERALGRALSERSESKG